MNKDLTRIPTFVPSGSRIVTKQRVYLGAVIYGVLAACFLVGVLLAYVPLMPWILLPLPAVIVLVGRDAFFALPLLFLIVAVRLTLPADNRWETGVADWQVGRMSRTYDVGAKASCRWLSRLIP
jgi:hypothetical protein